MASKEHCQLCDTPRGPLKSHRSSLEYWAWGNWACPQCGARHDPQGRLLDGRIDKVDGVVFAIGRQPPVLLGCLLRFAFPILAFTSSGITLSVAAMRLLMAFGGDAGPFAQFSLVGLGVLPVVMITVALILLGAHVVLGKSRSELEVTSTALRIDGTTYPFASISSLQDVEGGVVVTLEAGRSWTLHASEDVCAVVRETYSRFQDTRSDSAGAQAQRRSLAQLKSR